MTTGLTRFYRRAGIPVLLAALISLPWLLYGAQQVVSHNYNDVTEWLPDDNPATTDLLWFVEHFGGDEILAVSWPGCSLEDQRLPEFAAALEAAVSPASGELLFRQVFHGPEVLAQLQQEPIGLSREQAIERMTGWLVGPDGETSCAVALIMPGASRHQAVGAVFATAEEKLGFGRGTIYIGGPTVDSVAIDDVTNRELRWMTLAAFLISVLVAWFALRSILLTGLVFLTAVYCQLFSLSVMYWTGQHMNSVLIMLPALIFVLSISASIHVVNYYLDALQVARKDTAVGQAVQTALKPCGLAAVTTSVGLGSLALSRIVPIQKFGVYAAIGTVAGLVLLFLLLPSALELFSRFIRPGAVLRAHPHRNGSRRRAPVIRFARGVIRSRAVILPIGFVLLLVVGSGVVHVESAVKLKSLFRPEAEVMQNYRWLEERLGPLVPVEVVLRFDGSNPLEADERMRLVRELHDRIAALDAVGGVISTATFAPPLPEGSGARSVLQRRLYQRRLDRHRQELMDIGYLATAESATGDKGAKGAKGAKGDKRKEELWRITARVPAMTELDYGDFLNRLERLVSESLRPPTPENKATGGDSLLPPSTLRANPPGQSPIPTVVICGGIPLFNAASKQLLEDLTNSFLLAFVLIALLLLVILASYSTAMLLGNRGQYDNRLTLLELLLLPLRTLLAMVPNVFPVFLVFGAMGWLGWKVDIGAMMTASVALGIAVDDTLHFLTWFQSSLVRGHGRRRAVFYAYRKCAPAMTQTTLVCSLGLMPFAISQFVPVARFAWLMAASLIAALLGDLLLLPGALSSFWGRIFEPAHRLWRRKNCPASPPEGEIASGEVL